MYIYTDIKLYTKTLYNSTINLNISTAKSQVIIRSETYDFYMHLYTRTEGTVHSVRQQ
jgi:hypothetical protein